MSPGEIWKALDISRQGAMDLLNPLLAAGLVEKTGGKKTGRYALREPCTRSSQADLPDRPR
jgi:DNA-binding IclR family transcriptional regulator